MPFFIPYTKTQLYIPVTLSAFLFSLFLLSCSRKETVKTVPPTPFSEKPIWVEQRPVNSAYYIGIGSCSKINQPLDYQNIAKKNAFNDLATEISVRIQGNTFLNSLEINKNFSEEFISTISTTTNEQIEGYEIAGIWEDKAQYWIYYRLNKLDYQRKKQEKKNKILHQANDYYQKGLEAENTSSIPAAIDFFLHGLFTLKPYWNETNDYLTETGKIYLDNELYAALQRVGSGLSIHAPADAIVLSSANRFRETIPIQVVYDLLPVKGITVVYTYQRENYMKPRQWITDEKGNITAEISDVNPSTKNNELDIRLYLELLVPTDIDKNIGAGLLKNIRSDTKRLPIAFISPSFIIDTDKKSDDKSTSRKILESALKDGLLKNNMKLATEKKNADYEVFIQSSATKGQPSQGFSVVFLDMTITVRDVRSTSTLFEKSFSAIKGIQLNEEAASIDAYKKGKEKIENEIVSAIIHAIL